MRAKLTAGCGRYVKFGEPTEIVLYCRKLSNKCTAVDRAAAKL